MRDGGTDGKLDQSRRETVVGFRNVFVLSGKMVEVKQELKRRQQGEQGEQGEQGDRGKRSSGKRVKAIRFSIKW